MSGLGAAALLTLKLYLLAIVISMAVALLIRAVEFATSAGGAARRAQQPPPREIRNEPAPVDEDLAVIAAAVHATLGAHRIVHIEEREGRRAWSASGRSAHHGSHNVSRSPHRAPPPTQRKP